MTTMRDVALRARVSTKTVSRVFNEDRHVTDETRERVQRAMTDLQYVPNLLARGLRVGKDAVLGVGVPDISDPFFASLTSGIESVAAARGFAVVVTSLGLAPERERASVEALLRRQILGLIVTPIGPDQSYLKPWPDTPVVFVDRTPTRFRGDSFVEDDRGGARVATEHLIRHGHRRIAFIGDTLDIATTKNRLEGYRDAMLANELDVDRDLVQLRWGQDVPPAELLAALSVGGHPTALFSSNARCSTQLLGVLTPAVRRKTAIVSFGDLALAPVIEPALTVIDQDPYRLGTMAAERMVAKLADPTKKLRRKNLLPIRLIERGSGELRPR